jgi:hypothetical protein
MHKIKAFLASIYGINAYKIKYNRNEPKRCPTHALVQNKLKEPTNTLGSILDLDLRIYD